MAVRRPLTLDSNNNLRRMTAAEVQEVVNRVVWLNGQNPRWSTLASSLTFNQNSQGIWFFDGTPVLKTSTAFGLPLQATSVNHTFTVQGGNIPDSKSARSIAGPDNLKPLYYNNGNLVSMSSEDIRDTFINPALDILTARSTPSDFHNTSTRVSDPPPGIAQYSTSTNAVSYGESRDTEPSITSKMVYVVKSNSSIKAYGSREHANRFETFLFEQLNLILQHHLHKYSDYKYRVILHTYDDNPDDRNLDYPRLRSIIDNFSVIPNNYQNAERPSISSTVEIYSSPIEISLQGVFGVGRFAGQSVDFRGYFTIYRP